MTNLNALAWTGLAVSTLLLTRTPGVVDRTGALECERQLLGALHRRDLASVKTAVEAGAPVNVIDDGCTPLLLATQSGDLAFVAYLLGRGANPNATGVDRCLVFDRLADIEESTPLHVACRRGRLALVRALIAAGAHVSERDGLGNTALHYAVVDPHYPQEPFRAEPEVVKELLRTGAEVGARDRNGYTALMIASERAVPALLAAGADVHARSLQGFTPLHYAAYVIDYRPGFSDSGLA